MMMMPRMITRKEEGEEVMVIGCPGEEQNQQPLRVVLIVGWTRTLGVGMVVTVMLGR